MDPVSATSSIIALVAFGIQASIGLAQVIESFKTHPRKVRELKEELDDLINILSSLQETSGKIDHLSALKTPLFRCGKACEEFKTAIYKCNMHSKQSGTSLRDWARLTYMGSDISEFKNLLAAYKSTIAIALGDANLRTSIVTVETLNGYKDMIQQTVSDLEESLDSIDQKLEGLLIPGRQLSDKEDEERGQLADGKESVLQCLQFCAQISAHLDEVQPQVLRIASTTSQSHPNSADPTHVAFSAPRATAITLKECRAKLTETSARLQSHLQQLENRNAASLYSGNKRVENSMSDEIDAIKVCLEFCSQASEVAQSDRVNIFEDINIAEDSHQAIISTVGDLISARKVTAGSRSRQLLGQVSDDSFQRFSGGQGDFSADKSILSADKSIETPNEQPHFENKYGSGRNLKPPKMQ